MSAPRASTIEEAKTSFRLDIPKSTGQNESTDQNTAPPSPGRGKAGRPPAGNVELPPLKEKVGRKIVVKPYLEDYHSQSYNFDPIFASFTRSVLTGKTRKLLYPFIRLYKFVWNALQETLYRNMQGKFIDNEVRTARYTILDFLPKQILLQFSKFANLYFLLISMLQIVPGWSPTGQFTTIFPLSVFVTLAMLKEGWEDWQRHKQDNQENGTIARRLRLVYFDEDLSVGPDQVIVVTNDGQQLYAVWEDICWKDIRVGDILFIEENDVIPADLVPLSSSHPNGACYIETSNLDGESNLKQKQALSITQDSIKSIESFAGFSCTIHAESPTGNIYQFEGYIEIDSQATVKSALTINQLLPRGTSLANTKFVYGVAVYTGEESKIRKNATRAVRSKAPSLESITNRIVVFMFIFVIVLSAISTVLSAVWEKNRATYYGSGLGMWYLSELKDDIVTTFFSYIILYNTMIPISLYVAMEFVKLVQVVFINSDNQMFDEANDTPAQARTSNLHEELGQVQYLFTDKTGTLTENVMVFKKLSVAGLSYVFGGNSDAAIAAAVAAAAKSTRGSLHFMNIPSASIPTENLIRDILTYYSVDLAGTDLNIRLAHDFLLAMSLCHTVLPDRNGPPRHSSGRTRPTTIASYAHRNSGGPPVAQISPEDMAILYQSSSPDEVALVDAARKMTFVMRGRTMTTVTLNTLLSPKECTYQILHTIEFSSSRKRMSIIYEYPDGRIMLLCKGADSVILDRLRDPAVLSEVEIETIERTIDHIAEFASEGLRTLLYASRELSFEEYQTWSERWEHASMALNNRAELMDEVAEEIEQDLNLLGATAIEDKLQDGVPDTIDKLRRAGMKVWMLTGDKRETAINIGYTCQLIQEMSEVLVLDASSIAILGESISTALNTCISKKYALESISKKVQKDDKERSDNPISHQNAQHMTADGRAGHVVVVIDGDAISKLESQHNQILAANEEGVETLSTLELSGSSYLNQFIQLGILCDAVICCRFSPSQKALLVSKVRERVSNLKWIKMVEDIISKGKLTTATPLAIDFGRWLRDQLVFGRKPSGVTLAIGDGANDIPMLLCAHVGIGITGREGLAASRAADYAVAQFRFLQPLLFIHGRWSYIRISLFTLGTFYKCLAFYFTQLLFQIFTGWSGTSLYEQWTLTLYNILFSSLPVIAVGIFEKDLNKSTLLCVPELYRYGQFNRGLNACIFLKWALEGIWHAVVSVFVPFLVYNCFTPGDFSLLTKVRSLQTEGTVFTSDMSGPWQESSIFALGTASYTVIVLLVNIKVCYMDSHNWTSFTHLAFFVSISFWWLFTYVYTTVWPKMGIFGVDTAGMWAALNPSQLRFWIVQALAVVLAFGFFDAILHPGLWRFGASAVRVKKVKMPADSSLDDSKDKEIELRKKPSTALKKPTVRSVETNQVSYKSFHKKKASRPSYTSSGTAAAEFARSLRTMAEDGSGLRKSQDWSELVPLWQQWEKENLVTADQEATRDAFYPTYQSIVRCRSASYQDREDMSRRETALSVTKSASLRRPASNAGSVTNRPTTFGPKPSRGDSVVRNASYKRPQVLGSSIFVEATHVAVPATPNAEMLKNGSFESKSMAESNPSGYGISFAVSSTGLEEENDRIAPQRSGSINRKVSHKRGKESPVEGQNSLSRASSLRREPVPTINCLLPSPLEDIKEATSRTFRQTS
ncbi:hypothetical protein HDU67_006054 [Dinochytrium kinnereticum]|nr:hypothetical protein HDU67_006054 [Dinochytrium kinnereticum]